MGRQSQQAPGPHVDVRNRNGFLYLDGNDLLDQSMRIKRDDSGLDGKNFQFQFRGSGGWNDTGLRISETSISVGRDLIFESAGEWIKTFNRVRQQSALIPHADFDETGSTVVHAPQVGAQQIRLVIQPIDISEVVSTSHKIVFFNFRGALRTGTYYRVGSVAATEPVVLTARRDDINGEIFFSRSYAPSVFSPANSEVFLDLRGLIEFASGINISIELSSVAPFALKYDGGSLIWVAVDLTPIGKQEMIQDNLTLSRELDITFDREANWVTKRYF